MTTSRPRRISTISVDAIQSGERDYDGRVSKCGDAMDAHRPLRGRAGAPHAHPDVVLAKGLWYAGGASARRQKAIVALARHLAVVMHRMWVDGTEFRWRKEADTAVA